MSSQIITSSARLLLRTMDDNDAAFYLRLVNEPSFIQNIRDKGIRTLDDAKQAIQTGHQEVQEKMGFSLYLVERKADGQAIGLCGLVKRPELDNIDIGYATYPNLQVRDMHSKLEMQSLNWQKICLSSINSLRLPHSTISHLKTYY